MPLKSGIGMVSLLVGAVAGQMSAMMRYDAIRGALVEATPVKRDKAR